MVRFCIISSLCILCFSTLIPLHRASSMIGDSSDLVNETCTICGSRSKTACVYDFCLYTLQPVPVSHITNLEGLAIITMELALENATATLSIIRDLMDDGGGGLDPYASACLRDCSELYVDTIDIIMEAVAAFLDQQYFVVNIWISAAMEAASTCERGFAEKRTVSSPLTKENYNLFMLCKIILCMMKLLSMSSSAVST